MVTDDGGCCGSSVLEVFGAYVGISSINMPFFLPLRFGRAAERLASKFPWTPGLGTPWLGFLLHLVH